MAIYHLNVKTGSRIGGQSARAKSDYIGREGKYEKDGEELEYKESGNMPEWAEDDPRGYWAGADAHERANGRLYREVEFALPRELNAAERVQLATRFAEHLTGEERLPYTLAVHRGGQDGENPHAHLMISERANDGIERSAGTVVQALQREGAGEGGARKSTTTKPRDWLEQTREDWADQANEALDRAGRPERINEASLKDQYFEAAEAGDERAMAHLNREPGVHIGPHNVARAERGEDLDRVTEAGDAEVRRGVQWIEAALEFVDQQIRELTERIAERVRETWDRNRQSIERDSGPDVDIGRDSGPDIDWSR